MKNNFRFHCPGFSFVEFLIVLGIAVSTAAVGTISFHFHLSETLLRTSAQELASTLRWARRLAITRRNSHKVSFEPEEGKYWVEDAEGYSVEGITRLKDKIVFSDPGLRKWGIEDGIVESGVQDDAISFYPQGTAEAGSIYLKDKRSGNWYTVTITPLTGKVRVYEGVH